MLGYQFQVLKCGPRNGLLVRLADLQQRPDALYVIGRQPNVGAQPPA
ncbi:MAG: hypothetical protein IT159_09130 [Bryobacterales bacterium]|nr:hypothetical protein [Bryobacterales bacterium]